MKVHSSSNPVKTQMIRCLLYLENENAQVAIKNSEGEMSKRVDIQKIEMQGTVWASLKCTAQQDKLGQKAYQNDKPMYIYKDSVSIPPMGYVDDVITISKCGNDAVEANAIVNAFTESKKLQYSIDKCKKMHIGQSSSLCPQMSVNGFEMAYSELEKYQGELLSKDCQNNPNIITKASKGLGLIAQIKVLISEISLGFHYFEVATLLRDSILINGMLTNIEVIYGLTEENLKVLENVDKIFIQYILSGHSKTKHEAYYLELGIIPIKFIVMSRRIMFLHYLLSRNANELLVKFFKAQVSKPGKND